MSYRLDSRGYIPGRGKTFFSTPQHPDLLWDHPVSYTLGNGGKDGGTGKLPLTHLHPVLRSRMMELQLHILIHLHGMVLN
jgi:hypothetical protein